MKSNTIESKPTKTLNQERIGSGGQFNQFGVEQGYCPSSGLLPYQHNLMACIPLKDRMISIPVDMLVRMEDNLTKTVQRSQDNNIEVARSVLQSSVFCFLQFEKAFKSLLSKGDDNTQLYNLEKCIAELKQANASQKEMSTHDFSWLVTCENPSTTNARELFEHCIKVIEEFLPLLGGRKIEANKHEKVRNYVGWSGWQQQSEQIWVSNLALGRLLQKFLKEEPKNEIYREINCFQQSVAYILSCFKQSQYPKQKEIEEIYTKSDFKFITEDPIFNYELKNVISVEEKIETDEPYESTEAPASTGIFGSLWGNS